MRHPIRLIAIFAALALATQPLEAMPDYTDMDIPTVSQDARNVPVVHGDGYDYAPTGFYDAGTGLYHVYWCGYVDGRPEGGPEGDYVLHAQSHTLDGPWAGSAGQRYDIALRPSNIRGRFDRIHVCDPTVIRAGDRYFMYYGGLGAHANSYDVPTAIGVASSADGITFQRENNGRPVVTVSRSDPRWAAATAPNAYGVGQPSVSYRAPYFYLSFTDTSAIGSDPASGAGQFMLRTRDPRMQTDMQELTAQGWQDRSPGARTGDYSYLRGMSVDLAYDPRTDLFLIASNRDAGKTRILAMTPSDMRLAGQGQFDEFWSDGAGLLTDSLRQALPREAKDCARLNIGVFVGADRDKGTQNDPWRWDITYSQAVMNMARFC